MQSMRSRSRPRSRPGSRSGQADAGRTARVLAAERRIAFVAHLLDDLVAVPGTRSRVGLDPLIGLVPFLGDVLSGLVGFWIVLEAARFRLPGVVLGRMIVNATVDFLVGLVPFVGDIVDFGFKGNRYNLELFHRHATDPGASTTGHSAFLAGLVLVFIGVLWLGVTLASRLLGMLLWTR